jgi:hypothetical protein
MPAVQDEKHYICGTVRRGLAYFFLVIFLYNSMGNYLVFELNKFRVRQAVQAMIRNRKETGQCQVFKVFQPERNPDFQRIEAREFRFRGRLYDIIRETRRENVTTFYCIQDKKEELLITGFKEVQNRKSTQSLLHHLITQALPVDLKNKPEPPATDVLFREKTSPISLVFIALPGHPPELS